MFAGYRRRLYGYLVRMTRRRDTAEDLLQEAYLRAFRYFDSWHGQNPRTWFLAIVRNVAWRALELRRRLGIPLVVTSLGDDLRVSKERIRQLQRQAIRRMQQTAKEQRLEPLSI